jgi:hypothetical protein
MEGGKKKRKYQRRHRSSFQKLHPRHYLERVWCGEIGAFLHMHGNNNKANLERAYIMDFSFVLFFFYLAGYHYTLGLCIPSTYLSGNWRVAFLWES